jgi:hypothetical protein
VLQRDGYTEVFNVEGAIFAWADRGLPLVCGDQPTARVHPYDSTWSALLAAERRSVRGTNCQV